MQQLSVSVQRSVVTQSRTFEANGSCHTEKPVNTMQYIAVCLSHHRETTRSLPLSHCPLSQYSSGCAFMT